jgi:hypothetical protein
MSCPMEDRPLRSCDGCIACCVVLQVPELHKAQLTCCPKLDAATPGCSIYTTRPHSCRIWECLWLQGVMPEAASPKVCGVMFSDQATPLNPYCIVATELWDGALTTPAMESLVNTLAMRHIVITNSRQGIALRGPAHRQAEMVQRVNAQGFLSLPTMSDETYGRLQTMMGTGHER